jgi:hypothetical protein
MGHNLAYFSSSSSGSGSWVTAIVIITVIVVTGVAFPFVLRWMTKFRGDAQAGTGQVLSLRQFGSVGGLPRMVCLIRLRVEVPSGEPYDATTWRTIYPWALGPLRAGSTVPVEVDSANPKRVRINLSQPIQRHEGSAGPTRTVFNAPPTVTFNQSSWSPQAGWSGPPPPADVADQIKAALEGAFEQSHSAGSGFMQPTTPPTVAEQVNAYMQNAGTTPVISAAAILASGQRVPAVLKSFAATGTTPRSLGRTPSRPELIDAPHYLLEVELHFPNLGPVDGRAVQPVPLTEVPNLAIGLRLTCAVDQADPSHRFVVDWDRVER